MQNAVVDTDVLIVGAGPVGLFLANECARRGLRLAARRRRTHRSRIHSKALAIFPRTLEIFDMAGLVDPFLEAANRVTSVAVMAHGRTLAHMRFAPEESPYPFIAMVPQNVTERLLVEQLQRRGGAVEYETTFVSAVQQDDRVSVDAGPQGRSVGATAAIRRRLRRRAQRGPASAEPAVRRSGVRRFVHAGRHRDQREPFPPTSCSCAPANSGPVAIFPDERHSPAHRGDHQNAQKETLRRSISCGGSWRERAPSGIEARALHWSSYFRIHHRQVAQLRVGRIFIAGDAAHIHSPFGGQGMNTGLHDVWNLVWKLDLVLHGHGNEELLESYSAERRPVIKQVIETTDFLTRAMGTPNKFAQALRDAVIPMVSRLAPFQHAFVQRLSELGIAYRGSPIVEGAGRAILR